MSLRGVRMKRNPELESAIIAAPRDPEPRMIYADWLQAEGDPWGEWVALRAAAEATPHDLRLRLAAVSYQAAHHDELFGAGALAVKRGYLGSSGGFIDEVRIQPHAELTPAAVRALFAHPSMRFVRHVACGGLVPKIGSALVEGLVAARLPLLEDLVVQDATADAPPVELRGLAALKLRSLSCKRAWTEEWLPTLRHLTFVIDDEMGLALRSWLAAGRGEELAVLTLVHDSPEPFDAYYASQSPRAVISTVRGEQLFEPRSIAVTNPILEAARTGGRTAVRDIPGAGYAITRAIEAHLRAPDSDPRAALALGEIAPTLPIHGTTSALYAGLVRERAGDLVGAELCAREALVSSPRDPNFYAMAIDAMRRDGRIAQAIELIPAATEALADPEPDALRGGSVACLVDCMLAYARGGQLDAALGLAARFPRIAGDARCAAVQTIIHVLADRPGEAKAAWKRAAHGEGGVIEHARALVAKKPAEVERAIAAAIRTGYGDQDWMMTMVKR